MTTVPELNLEALAGSMKPDFDCLQTDAERLGDLRVREAFDFAQDEYGPIAWLESVDVLIQAVAHFPSEHPVLRVRRPVYRGPVVGIQRHFGRV
jgi:hypothetical protein